MSNRTNARAGCKALLDAYVSTYTNPALPTFIGEVLDHPPSRVTGRCAWVNKGVGESFGFGANVQQRVLQPSITVVNKITSSEEYTDEQDAIIDALLALVTTLSVQNTIRALTQAPLLPVGVTDEEVTADDGSYVAFRLTFNLPIQTGYNI